MIYKNHPHSKAKKHTQSITNLPDGGAVTRKLKVKPMKEIPKRWELYDKIILGQTASTEDGAKGPSELTGAHRQGQGQRKG